MIFRVLGSGAFAPGPGERGARVRNPAGYALETPEGVLLFDFGFGNLRQLYRAGLESRRVSHAFFTHRHPDHCGDLAALLFHLHYDAKPVSGELRVYGPEGFRAFWERLRKAYGPWLEPQGYRLTVAEVSPARPVEGPGWRVACRPVPHPTPAVAYRLDSERASLCYTGDTGFDAGIADFARGVDLFVLECTLPDRARYKGHLRVADALRLARAARAKRTLLSHLSEASAAEAKGRLPAGVGLARDLQRIRL
ncbi:MAG: ribonuclease Z [Elusimicrobia bacterium]|nr:ribonuclease Z [Elusimicrobiota bacterium]